MRILVVDDSSTMRRIVRRALSAAPRYADATVVEAENGRAALASIAESSPDAILSDWNMPEMSGIELLEALAASGAHPPLGFVTSESTPEMHHRAMAAGASFLVSKPFTPEALADALDAVV